jgi:predicted PurR-regulated permease PerM
MRRVPRFLIFCTFFTITTWGIITAKPVLVPLCLAILLAFLMSASVQMLRKVRFPEALALSITFLLFVLPFFLLSYELLIQGHHLIEDSPRMIHLTEVWANRELNRLGLHVAIPLDNWHERLSSHLARNAESSFSVVLTSLRAIFSSLVHLAIIMILAILMVAYRRHLAQSIQSVLAHETLGRHEDAAVLIRSVSTLIQRFLSVRLAIAVGVGTADFIVLKILGFEYSLVTGVFLGLMTLVPIVGFLIGVIPPLVIGTSSGMDIDRLIAAFLCLSIVSFFETHLITPKFLGKHLNLNLLFVFLALFVGEKMWGAWGMVLSLPILGVLRIIFNTSYAMRPWGNLLAAKETWTSNEVARIKKAS